MDDIVPSNEQVVKTCPRCQQSKPLSEFHRNRTKVKGYHSECKECRKLPPTGERTKNIYPDGWKRCSSCRRIKPFESFYKSTRTKDGYGFECKECNDKRGKRRYAVPNELTIIIPPEKKCHKCEEVKPSSEFYFKKGNKGKGYLDSWCVSCSRASAVSRSQYSFSKSRKNILRTYGLTIEDYDKLLEAQNGVCAACGEAETKIQYGRVMLLAVDHDHKTGKVRGLLCADCNRALGFMKDSPNRIAGLLKYAQSWDA